MLRYMLPSTCFQASLLWTCQVCISAPHSLLQLKCMPHWHHALCLLLSTVFCCLCSSKYVLLLWAACTTCSGQTLQCLRYLGCTVLYVSAMHVTCCCCVDVALPSHITAEQRSMGDCTGCQNVRNRNLAILSKSGLNLKKLAIGHASPISYGKPRITNQVCAPCCASSSQLCLL